MNEKANESLFKKQKNVRPKIEDVLFDALEGDALKNAQDFLAFIKENKMTPSWASANSWKVSYKGKGVCYIRLHGVAWYPMDASSWHLSLFAQYDKHLRELILDESEAIKTHVYNQVAASETCGGCMPGVDRKQAGKEFASICACTSFGMKNPNDNFLEFAKKLVAIRRDAIKNNRMPKCSYVKPADRKN